MSYVCLTEREDVSSDIYLLRWVLKNILDLSEEYLFSPSPS